MRAWPNKILLLYFTNTVTSSSLKKKKWKIGLLHTVTHKALPMESNLHFLFFYLHFASCVLKTNTFFHKLSHICNKPILCPGFHLPFGCTIKAKHWTNHGRKQNLAQNRNVMRLPLIPFVDCDVQFSGFVKLYNYNIANKSSH